MRIRTAALLLASFTAANAASVYPVKPVDARAVYLTSDAFGVHADGRGDDAPAIQKAIDKVQESSGHGIVFVPPGKYRFGSVVNLWKGIRLIGYGPERPVFLLARGTPGYAEGEDKYMVHFRDARPRPGEPLADARNTTFYSGINNIDFALEDGNPAAVAVRFHVAQLSSLENIDFRVGSARGAVEAIGNEIENCRFFGGEFGIRTGATSPGWQALILDSIFEGQRRVAIDSNSAGLTILRTTFRNLPAAISVPANKDEKLLLKDSLLSNVTETGIVIANYWSPATQVNIESVECDRVPRFLRFIETGVPPSAVPLENRQIMSPGPMYLVRAFRHGIHHENAATADVSRRLRVTRDIVPLQKIGGVPGLDYDPLPPQKTWTSVADFGAKGDGAADDTGAFEQAIAKHRAIYVPIGRYRLTRTLKLRPDTAIAGLNCMSTAFVLADGTEGFGDPARPEVMVEAPAGGSIAISGMGFDGGRNPGAVSLVWKSGERSLVDDTFFQHSRGRAQKGKDQLHGIWVKDGGGGVFKNIWAPNDKAQTGFYVTDTSTRGRLYEVSVEHHVDVEVKLERVSNWEFYALQTEENIGSEKAIAIDIGSSRNLRFLNLFMYRIRANSQPSPHAVRVAGSGGLTFGGLHNWSGGPFGFDTSVLVADRNYTVTDRELTYLTIP